MRPEYRWNLAARLLMFACCIALIFSACKPSGKIRKTVRVTCGETMDLPLSHGLWKVPVCRDLMREAREMMRVKRAVILVPGADRNAEKQFEKLSQVMEKTENRGDGTLLRAVQFLTKRDVRKHHLAENYLYWDNGWEGWKYGYDAESPSAKVDNVSSYEVMDSLVERIIQRYPKLEQIVIAGHSAGGQFVQRYAAGNRIETIYGNRIRFRYVVANPSSYLYFSPERRRKDGSFGLPDPYISARCPRYDQYKFGLSGMEDCDYMAETGSEKIRANYRQRNVVLLLGEKDNDPRHKSLDNSCQADMQGEHRLERGENFYAYLKHFFGPEISDKHILEIVPEAGHGSSDMFRSMAAKKYLFNE